MFEAKGFPYFKRYFLFWKRPDGWEDLGTINNRNSEDGKSFSWECHDYCITRISIGKHDENGELFKFCGRCLIVLKVQEKDKDETVIGKAG